MLVHVCILFNFELKNIIGRDTIFKWYKIELTLVLFQFRASCTSPSTASKMNLTKLIMLSLKCARHIFLL